MPCWRATPTRAVLLLTRHLGATTEILLEAADIEDYAARGTIGQDPDLRSLRRKPQLE